MKGLLLDDSHIKIPSLTAMVHRFLGLLGHVFLFFGLRIFTVMSNIGGGRKCFTVMSNTGTGVKKTEKK